MINRTGGIVIGRFMPPHAGHQYLIHFARAYCDQLTVFVCTLRSEPIPGELRHEWLREMFPSVSLVHITEEIPQAERNQRGAQQIWADAARAHLDADPRYVFASEEYGLELAAALGAEFVPVDPNRTAFPISAAQIRDDPITHWRFVPVPVRPYFARRFSVVSRHSEVIAALADRFETVYCPDYTLHLQNLGYSSPSITEPADIFLAQAASQRSLVRHANRVLFLECDLLLAGARLGLTTNPGPAEASPPQATEELPHVVLATCPLETGHRDRLQATHVPVVGVDSGPDPGEEVEKLSVAVEQHVQGL